jgi:hypothetical protein
MASLCKNDFGFTILQHFSSSEPILRIPRTYGLYRFEVGINLPNSSQYLASKSAPDPPIMDKITKNS